MDNKIIEQLIDKIKDIPLDTETSISELIEIDNTIDPLTQGEIFNKFVDACIEKKIKIKLNDDSLSGLAFHYKFKRELNIPEFEKTKIAMTTEGLDENGRATGCIKEIEVPTGKLKEDKLFEMMTTYKEDKKTAKQNKKLNKYFKKFEKRFGRRPYIPEPSGTKEATIKAIKICLKKKEDIFDELVGAEKKDVLY